MTQLAVEQWANKWIAWYFMPPLCILVWLNLAWMMHDYIRWLRTHDPVICGPVSYRWATTAGLKVKRIDI